MGKKIFRFCIFIIIITVLDQLSGFFLKNLYQNSKSGTFAKLRYTIDSTKQDILIFGSSRAENHYIPNLISNYTGLSSYNCGVGGQGLIFSFIQISKTLKRYKPKIIVLDISPNMIADPTCDDRMKVLMPYAQQDTMILNALTNESKFEKYKYFSSIYPYNGLIGSLLTGIFSNYTDEDSGYFPLNGQLKSDRVAFITANFSDHLPQLRQVDYFIRIMKICNANNIKLLLVISPIYFKSISDEQINREIIEIAESEKIPIVNFADSVSQFSNENLFRDNYHLNRDGAAIFSKEISNYILSRHYNFN